MTHVYKYIYTGPYPPDRGVPLPHPLHCSAWIVRVRAHIINLLPWGPHALSARTGKVVSSG
jgi:hypothetical protein